MFNFILSKPTKMLLLKLFFGFEYAPNHLSAGASPQILLGELTALPLDPRAAFKGTYF